MNWQNLSKRQKGKLYTLVMYIAPDHSASLRRFSCISEYEVLLSHDNLCSGMKISHIMNTCYEQLQIQIHLI